MRVLSIILIVALCIFTLWQLYLTIKKIILRRKSVVTNSKSNLDVQASEKDNSIKEVKE